MPAKKLHFLPKSQSQQDSLPLYVDLDGTLILSDTIIELFIPLMKKNFFLCFLIPIWIFRGRAFFKNQLSKHIHLHPKDLPYNQDLLAYLHSEKKKGRALILATGSFEREAQAVADYLGIFDAVLASTDQVNLVGLRKAEKIREHSKGLPFAYAGNSAIDLKVWKSAQEAIVVNANDVLHNKAKSISKVTKNFPSASNKITTIIKAARVHQWVKNLLLFVPIIAAQKIADPTKLLSVFLAFFAFNFCASSVYLLNDLFDLAHDRRHPFKKKRPFASGDLNPWYGVFLTPLFLCFGLILGSIVGLPFLSCLIIYFTMTFAYSYKLKSYPLIDVLILAALYTWRVAAGGIAADILLSPWLLSFSSLIFFSLALSKRSTEILMLSKDNELSISGRGYQISDLPTINQLGISSGLMAVVIFGLYVNSNKVQELYLSPNILWFICPILLYWISRIWLLTSRGRIHHDPIVFTLTDRVSYTVCMAITMAWTIATLY